MKIEGDRPNVRATTARRADETSANRGREAVGAEGAVYDRVALSNQAATASRAMVAAAQAPDIRADLVEGVRAKVLAGEVGRDVDALADRIIGALIDP